MKKYWWIFLIFFIILVIGGITFFLLNKGKTQSNYISEKSSFNTNNDNNVISNKNTVSSNKNTTEEIEIANFSTKIKNKKDTNRQQNITITCNALNNTIVNSGSTFSFCDTVGQATSDKGYREANIIVEGEEIKGLGGGNCQISSTLYNAVLACKELEVTERHPHSAPVPYIEQGKDAAVSYGAHDFKFKNNSDSTIKILAENTPDNITIRLIKLVTK